MGIELSPGVAYLLTLSPGSADKKTELVKSLSSSPPTSCTTSTFFAPSSRGRTPPSKNPLSPTGHEVLGLQVFSTPSTAPHAPAGYAAETWKPVKDAGFLSRDVPMVAGKNVFVLVAIFKINAEDREKLLRGFSELAKYVKASEDKTLSYQAFVSPTKEDQIMIFERYADPGFLATHGSSKPFKDFMRSTKGILKGVKLTEWDELDVNGFVGGRVDAFNQGEAAAGASKL